MMQAQIEQPIWDEEVWPYKVFNPVLCQCPIQLLSTVDSQIIIAKQKCDDQIWMTGREILQEITDNRPTFYLNLMWNQLTCLNASITLSNFPIMMQAQIWATIMRWGGMLLKGLQPFLVPMLNTTISHSKLSHYNCQTEMWWPNLDDWKRNLAREARPTID